MTNPLAQYALEITRQFQKEIDDLYVIPPLPIPQHEFPIPQHELPIPQHERSPIEVCIIGAGAAGLYTAMLLDWIRNNSGLDRIVTYKILEAAPRERKGGRVWTHDFRCGDFDYVDLGAARYPYIPIMRRVFDLFKRLEIGDVQHGQPDGKLLEYRSYAENTFLYYNDIRVRTINPSPSPSDAFKVGVKNGGLVPDSYLQEEPWHWVGETLGPFVKKFVDDKGNPTWSRGWGFLQQFDHHSMRSYMATAHATPFLKKALPSAVIDWCETRSGITGWFDCALTEAVLTNLVFGYPWPQLLDQPEPRTTKWYCIKGGSKVFIEEMEKVIETKPLANKRVTKIARSSNDNAVHVWADGEHTQYSHVISTIPLSTLRHIEFSGNACLTYAQKTAFRMLDYKAALKIAFKFRSRWWTKLPQPIRGGRSSTDLNLRSVSYPSYGSDTDSGVLVVSYTYGQDAQRLGALSKRNQIPKAYRDLILGELSRIHDVQIGDLEREYLTDWLCDWNTYEHSIGAFARFGPGQFKGLYPHVTQSAAGGRLQFAGEATSVLHGWVNGALDSAVRAVLQMMNMMNKLGDVTWTDDHRDHFLAEWKQPPEVNLDYLEKQVNYGAIFTSGEVLELKPTVQV